MRSTAVNGGRDPGVSAHRRSIQRHAINARSTNTRSTAASDPAQVGLRRRAEDGARIGFPEDDCRQADGNSDAKDAGWTQPSV